MSDTSKKLSRRHLLRHSYCGFGLMGLAGLLAERGFGTEPADPMAPKKPHFAPRAKRVIFMFMHGGPSIWIPSIPSPCSTVITASRCRSRDPSLSPKVIRESLLKSPWQFRQYGESGIPVSELFPNVARHVDDLCILRSVVGDSVAHGGAVLQLHTGSNTFTRPSMGSWAIYGLGTENQNLPAYLTLKPGLSHGGAKNWSSGFLPAAYQGTAVGHGGMSIDESGRADRTSEEQDAQRRTAAVRVGHAAADEPAERRPLESRSGVRGAHSGL